MSRNRITTVPILDGSAATLSEFEASVHSRMLAPHSCAGTFLLNVGAEASEYNIV